MKTLIELGDRVGRPDRGRAVAAGIESRLAAVRARVAPGHRPRTLIVFGRETFALRAIYASGGYGFIHDMVTAAGGENVFGDVKRQAVQATTEQILARRPEVILELRAEGLNPGDEKKELATWDSSRPSPRCGRTASTSSPTRARSFPVRAWRKGSELIARVLHPQ